MNAVVTYFRELRTATLTGWNQFWFTPADPHTICTIRIVVGLLMLANYIEYLPAIHEFIGPDAWIDASATAELHSGQSSGTAYERYIGGWYRPSVFSLASHETLPWMYGGFLIAIVALTVGFCSRTANLIVWIGHLSFLHRSLIAWYGLDIILAMLLAYLVIAPTGAVFSVDAWIRNRRSEQPVQPTVTTNLATRMIQIHMCIIYAAAGLTKLQGNTWWEGTAIWYVLMIDELALIDFRWLATLNDGLIQTLCGLATTGTLVFEIGFPALIWNRMLRPLVLVGSVCLHLGIGLVMGLFAFGLGMLTGCLAFVPPSFIAQLVGRIRHGRRATDHAPSPA